MSEDESGDDKKTAETELCCNTSLHVMFLSGVEYAVIFPTLWEYLVSFGVLPTQTYWLGLCLSSMTTVASFLFVEFID